jgi:hypothetical protein
VFGLRSRRKSDRFLLIPKWLRAPPWRRPPACDFPDRRRRLVQLAGIELTSVGGAEAHRVFLAAGDYHGLHRHTRRVGGAERP